MNRLYRIAICVLVASFLSVGWGTSAQGVPKQCPPNNCPGSDIKLPIIKNPASSIVVPTDQIPSPGKPYVDFSDDGQIQWQDLGVKERSFQFTPLDGNSPTMMPDGSWAIDSFFDIFYEIELEVSGVLMLFTGGGTAHMIGTAPAGGGDVRTFDTEMLALNISNPSFMIRESPTRASLGQTLLTSTPPFPPYRYNSSFDMSLELSLDGGQTWAQAVSHFIVPEPSTLLLGLLAGLAALLCNRAR